MRQTTTSKREPACFIYFFPFLLMHVAHCDRTSTKEGEKKKQEKCFCENPSNVVSCHRFGPSQNGPPVNVIVLSGFLCPSPSPPTLMTHTSLPNFLLKKLKEKTGKKKRKKKKNEKKMAMTRGQTASHYHNSGNHITVPRRLIQRSSRRTSHNLQRSNRNITLSNPPTLYMETDGNKKLIEEHPAPPTHKPHPIKPHTTPGRLKYV